MIKESSRKKILQKRMENIHEKENNNEQNTLSLCPVQGKSRNGLTLLIKHWRDSKEENLPKLTAAQVL